MSEFLDLIWAAAPWVAAGLAIAIVAARGIAGKKEGKKQETDYSMEGLCLGMCFGTALGTALRIEFETWEGSLRMTLTAPDGTVLYTGSGKDATAFTVGIPESGAYTVTVEARHAKGTIRISAAG